MPKRTDIKSILIIGAGPIVVGQACEFDYSGTQACKALKQEGYRIILANSNPATIMTDPKMADATYIEPLDEAHITAIIEKEKPDALLSTMGGQTALNISLGLAQKGILKKHKVEIIGANPVAIQKAESRTDFRKAVSELGLESVEGKEVSTLKEGLKLFHKYQKAVVIRPSFTLGGSGGGLATDEAEFKKILQSGLNASPVGKALVERSVAGWKEYEMEVVRDRNDNCIVVCSIENVDPMGVHTGDSVTVAPALTLTDKEYQKMRSASFAILRKIGVETGGSNVQFAINPKDGRMVVIEMNPRVSRSSALASKATGFPIAKVAARLAVGYSLDELKNDITLTTPASFEPTIDYIITKIPRFAFEKFPKTPPVLSSSMRSVGEVMGVGRNFAESLQKALRSLETGLDGLDPQPAAKDPTKTATKSQCLKALKSPSPHRLLVIAQALREGATVAQVHRASRVDEWFIRQIQTIVEAEKTLAKNGPPATQEQYIGYKQLGFSDRKIHQLSNPLANKQTGKQTGKQAGNPTQQGKLNNSTEDKTESDLKAKSGFASLPVYKRIDTCSGEFLSHCAYLYSTWELPALRVSVDASVGVSGNASGDASVGVSANLSTDTSTGVSTGASSATSSDSGESSTVSSANSPATPSAGSLANPSGTPSASTLSHCESNPSAHKKVAVLGSGPARIGQGIEFDYCCVHASMAVREAGLESIMINCNPETVSTDYDISDKLYFEPLTAEDVIHILKKESQNGNLLGVIVQLGGQTPLKLCDEIQRAGFTILGTSPANIDKAEDRKKFSTLARQIGALQPKNATVTDPEKTLEVAKSIGYPLVIRPSYVLGGRAMEIVYDEKSLKGYLKNAFSQSEGRAVLLDSFLADACELDVDALCDGKDVYIAAVMEHIERAGVHSGDSACSFPPHSLSEKIIKQVCDQMKKFALKLQVKGLINGQFAVKNDKLYTLEINPRASRTVPFAAKVSGVPLANLATQIMLGKTLKQLGLGNRYQELNYVAVKEAVFPFDRFPNTDVLLGPEMKSTGEAMGIAHNFASAFAKSQIQRDTPLPTGGTVFLSLCDKDKTPQMVEAARQFQGLGFKIVATKGTCQWLAHKQIKAKPINKVREGKPHVVDMLTANKAELVINTTDTPVAITDSFSLRRAALESNTLYYTTIAAAMAALEAIKAYKAPKVAPLQSYLTKR